MSFAVSSRGIIPERLVTMKHVALTATDIGKPVKITANMTVGLCTNNDYLFGTLQSVDAESCVVLIEGVIEMPYTGGDPSPGFGQLVADGSGGVKTSGPDNDGFKNFMVLEVNTTAKTVTFILQN